MAKPRDSLFVDALALQRSDRARLAQELLWSLEDARDDKPADVEAAWAAEIERRLGDLDRGEAKTVPWPEARARIQRAIRKGRKK